MQKQKHIQHLSDKNFRHKNVPEFNLTVDEYSKVLDSVVTANVDTILHNPNGEILLGKRADKPLQDELWIFGGRMKPGESINDTVVRNLRREVGIEIDEERLIYSNVYNIMWPGRAEPPQEHGFQTMMTIMKYECTLNEAEQVLSADKTHTDMRWYSQDELRALQKQDKLHPYLVTILTDTELL